MIYKELTDAVEIEMRKNGDVTAEQIENTKMNLRQRIEQSMHGYNFVTVQRQLYIYPDTLLIQNVVVELIEQGKELDKYKKATFEEKHLFKAAEMIRNDVKSYMTKTVKTTVNKKIIPMKATRNLFAYITLIMEKRQLDLT